MKNYRLFVLVPALLLLMLANADAGVTAETFSVSPYLGGYSFLGREHLDTRPVYGVRLGYNFTPHFGVEAVTDFLKTEGAGSGGDVDIFNGHLDALYHFLPEGPWVPYLAAGYGWQSREYPGDRDKTWPCFNYGPGLKYFLREGMAVRGDLRHLIMKHDDHTFHNVEYSVGVDFLFGHPKAVAAAATEAAPAAEAPIEPGPCPGTSSTASPCTANSTSTGPPSDRNTGTRLPGSAIL